VSAQTFIISSLLIVAVALGAARLALESTYRRAALEVCDLIANHYHRRHDDDVVRFIRDCRAEAENQSFLYSKADNIRRINLRLERLGTSHMAVYNPDENRVLWDHVGLDTGIRSRFVEEYLIVHRVLPGSPAERAGLKPGDILLELNESEITSPQEAQAGRGVFRIARQQKKGDFLELEFEIHPEKVAEDMSAFVKRLPDGVSVLRVPSFLPRYFEDGSWKALLEPLRSSRHVILDVRENSGGSFPAMMRLLSAFHCEPRLVGQILRPPSAHLKLQTDLLDTLDTSSQLTQIQEYTRVNLRTFGGYSCYDGPVTVLIDSGTSSVAEIFAQAFFSRPRSRVWGQPSAGQVVMARWFSVMAFGGEDYSISIPIAGFVSVEGVELERKGVMPQRLLHHKAASSLEGRDFWIEEASVAVSQPTLSRNETFF
jgi:C-terminal processing protease CtpA/Prc